MVVMHHDARCEASWNDGVCACAERRIPRAKLHRPPPVTILDRLHHLFALHR